MGVPLNLTYLLSHKGYSQSSIFSGLPILSRVFLGWIFRLNTLPPMGYGSQRAVLLFKCAACAVVLAFAGVARSYGMR